MKRDSFVRLVAGSATILLLGCGTPASTDGAPDDSADGFNVDALAQDNAAREDATDATIDDVSRDVVIADAPASDAPRDVSVDTSSDVLAPTDGGAPTVWVMGYYAGYERALYPVDAVDFTSITHLAMGRIAPRAGGTLDMTFDIDATNGPALARALAVRAHAAGRRAILMVGGAGEHAGWVAASAPATRSTFVSNLLAAMDSLGYDGLDIDWEPVDAADQPNLRALAMALRAARPAMLLTIPVGWVNSNTPSVDAFYGTIAPLFDRLNIMSYGMAGAWPGWQSWHSSALRGAGASTPSSVDACVNAYVAGGVPVGRLGVGMGFYGSCWSAPVTAPRMALGASSIVADDGVMSYANILARYFDPAARRYDMAAAAPYLTFAMPHAPQGCTMVSYEDPESIAEKGAYVRMRGLGGAIIWTINQGYVSTAPVGMRDPLLAAVRTAFAVR